MHKNKISISSEYSIVCIYIPVYLNEKYSFLSDMEEFHMHTISSSFLPSFGRNLPSSGKPGTLYQWGRIKEKSENSRYPKVNEEERQSLGIIGLGSAASGGSESEGQFCGAGEGIILDSAYRITKGNTVFEMKPTDQYWMLQISAFKNAVTFSQKLSAKSRKDLLDKLLILLDYGDIPFISTFVAHFHSESALITRSNGILPTDAGNEDIQDSRVGFSSNGGHVLGSLETTIDIEGPVLIEPILDFKCLS